MQKSISLPIALKSDTVCSEECRGFSQKKTQASCIFFNKAFSKSQFLKKSDDGFLRHEDCIACDVPVPNSLETSRLDGEESSVSNLQVSEIKIIAQEPSIVEEVKVEEPKDEDDSFVYLTLHVVAQGDGYLGSEGRKGWEYKTSYYDYRHNIAKDVYVRKERA